MGQNSTTTQQSQNQVSAPWAPAIPGLTNIINQLTSQPTAVTPGQQAGATNLQNAANTLPNFGSQAAGAVSNLFGSTVAPNIGVYGQAYQNLQNVLSPYLQPGANNPYNAPGFGTALNTMNTDITNQINSEFAAAGRSGTGSPGGGPSNALNEQALARGLSQGEGGLIANESNLLSGQQIGAANQLFGAGANTATGTAQLQQLPYQNEMQALGLIPQVNSAYTSPAAAQLQAANVGQNLPFQNLQLPTSMLSGIASLGGQVQGTGTSTTTQPVNPWTTALGGGLGLLSLMPSDRRLKENIRKIGKAKDSKGDAGLPVYSYNFKGDPAKRPQIGLMAQDVEKKTPAAVVDIGIMRGMRKPIKAVDYDRALAA